MASTVLIIANDKNLSKTYAGLFNKKEFAIFSAQSGRQALSHAKSNHLDAIVVDVTSQRLNAKTLWRRLHGESSAPVVLIAMPNAKIDSAIKHAGVVPRPLVSKRLVARVKAAMDARPPRVLTLGTLTVDLEKHKLTRGNKMFPLTPKEFVLLKLLMTRAGQMVTRKTIIKEVWETDYTGDTRTLDVHMRWLREKVEESPSKPEHLLTMRGQGYKFVV
ncbi:MAG: response regulator transcription factor [Chloroflexi bacterium]|nr:response regulator transcription factor [Chloroflexota bacterium]